MPPSTLDSERLFAAAQELAHLGVWEWDLATNDVVWSDGLYALLGLEPGEVPPTFESLLARVHTDDQATVKGHVRRARRSETGDIERAEYRVVRPDGEVRTLQDAIRGTVANGALVRLVGVAQDITETKEVAARLVFTDRMLSVGTLAGGVAHEINNPLATISTNLQMLAASHGDPGLRDAQLAVERIRTVVRGLMAFSRPDEDHRAPIQIDRVLELAIEITGNEIRHRARLTKRYGTPPPVSANEARLGHVFINMLLNAAEAIPEGAADKNSIHVTTRCDETGWAVIEIADTGCGIAREHRDRVFDPFFTTKPVGRGTGLGLSICHGIVRALGGEITFTSDVGVGTRFTVALPPATESIRPRPPSDHPRVVNDGRGKVLVVDDEVLFATSLRRLLSTEHAVTVCNSGRDALALLRRGERFDAILCDLMMPEMTGPELHATILAEDPELAERMIFITGGAFTPASQAFLETVAKRWFEKPCDVEELRTAVRRRVAASRR